ncbi:hypothetical protein GCM10023205_60220 [Yinghuangia aomiensis]|uniref:Aminoglycoside phosphotransferase domain-containing protein n=2 Tax=Yinghuangia aomiensis TaxID=676205 RepID=A0ABP9HYR6_9ACTN
MRDAAARALARQVERAIHDGSAVVLVGQQNLSVRCQDTEHGALLYRRPKVEANDKYDRVWAEPAIIRAMSHLPQTPGIVYATPGWKRGDEHFMLIEYIEGATKPPENGPAFRQPFPERLVESDIPEYMGQVSRLSIDASPIGVVPPATREGFIDHHTRRIRQDWARVTGIPAVGRLHEDLDFPEDFARLIAAPVDTLEHVPEVRHVKGLPDIWAGNMGVLHDRTVFFDPELLTVGDPRYFIAVTLNQCLLPEDQEVRLQERAREELGVPERGFDEGVTAWRDLRRASGAIISPEWRANNFADSVAYGVPEETVAREIACLAEQHAAGWGKDMGRLGGGELSAEALAWAYRRMYEDAVARHKAAGSPRPQGPRRTLVLAVPEGFSPSSSVRAYAEGTARKRPELRRGGLTAVPEPSRQASPAPVTSIANTAAALPTVSSLANEVRRSAPGINVGLPAKLPGVGHVDAHQDKSLGVMAERSR